MTMHNSTRIVWNDFKRNSKFTENPSNRGGTITIMQAGSDNGFVQNCLLLSVKINANSSLDYHQGSDAQLFRDWSEHRFLQYIPKNIVIKVENTCYYCRKVSDFPISTRKKAII